MPELIGGHIVAKYLSEVENIDTVFALSGGHIESILDGFNEYGIRAIDVRHEQAAAMMAQSWSIYTGKPGVCVVTAGPGFTNSLTGIVNAYLDNAPLVVLSGRHPVCDDLKGALQEMNQADMVKPVTKWSGTCFQTERIAEYLSIAFRHATEGRPGPVFLELPQDMLHRIIDAESFCMPERRSMKYPYHPDDEELEKAARIINNARRPIFVGGSGIKFSQSQAPLREFIEKAGIPFSLLNFGRGVLPDIHPLSLAEGGFVSLIAALEQADVVVAAGIRLNWLFQYGKVMAHAQVVRIDIDPHEIDRNLCADAGLVGDCGSVLQQLTPMVEERDHNQWLTDVKNASKNFMRTELNLRVTQTDPIHPVRLVERIRQIGGDDAIYISDGGDTSYFGLSGFRSTEPAGVLNPSGGLFGCLGTGIPFGIGAKVARPDKTVIVFNGDGSFGFNAMEFDTAIRHDIPIVCVICNDCAWGMIKHSQEISIGPDRLACSELGPRNYEKIVEGLGGYGEQVVKDEEIVPALKRALESGKPSCINVLTDPTVTSQATIMFYYGALANL